MSSYLSYFTSSGTSQPQSYQQQRPATPTSTWSSAFSARISTLRNALTKDSEEDDPDNEDSSHVSNVLRAYYSEKGRPFPEWLPPDPKKPPPTPVQPANQYGQLGASYGGYGNSQYSGQAAHGRGGSGGRGGLSDLWDAAPAPTSAPSAQSLRPPRPTPQSLRRQGSSTSFNSAAGSDSYTSQTTSTSRPLPSQRAGSYQNTAVANAGTLGSRDRLRARLQGGDRSSSPLGKLGGGSSSSQNSGGGSPYVSASQPWSSGNDDYAHGGYTTGQQSGNGPRQRPGGPR